MPERCGYGGNDLGYQSIEVCVGWPGDAKVFSGQVIDCLLQSTFNVINYIVYDWCRNITFYTLYLFLNS